MCRLKKNLSKEKEGASLSLQETYTMMKEFKAEQKSIFYEVINRLAQDKKESYTIKNTYFQLHDYAIPYQDFSSWQAIDETFTLFQFKDESMFNKFLKLEKEIEKKVKKKNRSNSKQGKDEIREPKKKKGDYFFDNGKGSKIKSYINFCGDYKKIAMNLGKTKASIKGIEKEKIEAENTQYWALIFEEKKQEKADHFLWLIPKEQVDLKDAKKFLENPQRKNTVNPIGHVCYFKSLTKRALHKLCFAEESSFVKEMPGYLKTKQPEVKQSSNEKKKEELKFLKEVLKSDYAKEKLDLDDFDLSKVYQAKDLDDFEKELETACYHKSEISFSEENRKHFIQEYQVKVFKLTSYDLQERNKESEVKAHTKIWQDFWGVDKSIRLNPEIKIHLRRADENLKKYLQNEKFDSKAKHRRLQDQYTVSFTMALNAGKKHPELAFVKPEHVRKEINQFNKKFNEQNFEGLWKYGIDRGNIELATLCIAKFRDKDKYEHNNKSFLKPTFPDGEENIKCLKLRYEYLTHSEKAREEDAKEKKLIDNLSYFIDREDYFKKHSSTCIDLTTAKVIKGHIVLNGDIRTYLKLKKENAKRKIYDLFPGKFKNFQVWENLHWIDEKAGLLIPENLKQEVEDLLEKKITKET